MNIDVRVIPHIKQRYPTTGDWWFTINDPLSHSDTTLHVRVSAMKNWKYEAMVAVHEIVEALLCRAAGVSERAVTRFDETYEQNRKPDDDSEPGDDILAPYYVQHQLATSVERMVCAVFLVDWRAYEQANLDLYKGAK